MCKFVLRLRITRPQARLLDSKPLAPPNAHPIGDCLQFRSPIIPI